MKVTVDRDRCISAGMCALTAPDVFDQDTEDGRVLLRAEQPDADAATAVEEAAAFCPSGAIQVIE